MTKRCVFVTYRLAPESMEPLVEAGYEVIWPKGQIADKEELNEMITASDAMVTVFGNPFPDKLLEEAGEKGKLKILSNFGVGVDNINLELATRQGIVVANTPDQVTEPTAELAVTLMLSLSRRIAELDRKLRKDKKSIRWGVMENLGMTLQGKTLGIIGLGRIGKAMARRAKALDMEIVYFNRHRLAAAEESRLNVTHLPLDQLLQTADVVSLHTPLTEETFHLIDEEVFQRMKTSAVLVNTSRGAVVDEQALIRALQTKEIAGAALDVFENEPDIPDAFLTMDQVVVVPHIGTAARDTRIEIGKQTARNVLDFFDGKPLRNCVNPEVLKIV